MNLTGALTSISKQIKEFAQDGHDVNIKGVEIDRLDRLTEPETHGETMVTVETEEGGYLAASFLDNEPWNEDRRQALELAFATAIGITLAIAGCEVACDKAVYDFVVQKSMEDNHGTE